MDGNTVPPRGPAIDASSAFILLITIFAFFLPILLYFPPVPPSKRDALLETHTQVGLGSSKSGLKGHHDHPKNNNKNNNNNNNNNPTPQIRSLFIYPLKSCRGIELHQSKVLPTGLEFDRLYTFAQLKSPFPLPLPSSPDNNDNNNKENDTPTKKEAHTWHFITQRQFPLLATVQVDLFIPDPVKTRGAAAAAAGGLQPSSNTPAPTPFLLIRFPWRERGLLGLLSQLTAKLARGWRAQPEKEFVLPVAFPSAEEIAARGYVREEVTVWKEKVAALNMRVEVPKELALYLGVSNRLGLFRVDPGRLREVFRCAPRRAEVGYQPVTGFQDAYPLHLLNLTSVRDFEAKIEKDEALRELDPRRFRANIIVDGDDTPYAEETWKKIRLNPGPSNKRDASEFHVSCRTVRCKLPNVDQDTGSRHPVQPDKALRKFREVDEGAKHMGCLGMQVTPLFPKTSSPEDLESWVEVGMSVEVLERGEHVYIPQ